MDKRMLMTIARWRALGAASVLALGLAAPVAAQSLYPSPQAAADAFADAMATSDTAALAKVLGPNHRNIVPGGVEQEDVYRFLAAWSRKHEIVADGGRSWLAVGDSGWTLPVPIVRAGKGWRFDPAAGTAEIRRRAINRNELTAIETLLQLQAAQTRYKQGVGQGRYAARLVSRPGERDGLYWPELPDAPPQAFGPDALAMGPEVPLADAYYGYRYKVLPGANDNSYRIVAWPARYGQTGIGSFVVGPDGGVLEADLGPSSAARAAALRERDIGAGNWIDANAQPVGSK
ncbi:DUF2950 family protein [Achromobacter anxifer]|jgi:hypothetical protein|uniref:DUF2950 domain-containing protein n=1 Tax=Achromobacter anxifer TaxID=1287737 RepID=A0A6S7ETN7_9BURK|nr:DUF2950 family protein [Achromobacter anxifer]MDF8361034.1 DUF2950 family protein [Achromobacter anxifer]CAB3927421.1 hypothetical protein LMG26858_06015 [Achromobacter anxifer]CAB5515341.1 hypothetical protein LMG26857_04407 [Achromobacter anxifer]